MGISSEDLAIGSRSVSDPGEYFNGKIDEIMIFNRALTQTEINDIYHYYVS